MTRRKLSKAEVDLLIWRLQFSDMHQCSITREVRRMLSAGLALMKYLPAANHGPVRREIKRAVVGAVERHLAARTRV